MPLVGFQKFRPFALKIGMCTCLLLISTQFGWAAGTPSGTTISNSATLTYTIGAGPATSATSVATFTVDDKVNVLVAGGVITNVSPNQIGVATPFTVTNNGNATQGYNLAAANATSGAYTVNATPITDNFDPATALRICLDDGSGGGTANDGGVVLPVWKVNVCIGVRLSRVITGNDPMPALASSVSRLIQAI